MKRILTSVKLPNVDLISHVRGESIYLDDIPLIQGTLFARDFGAPLTTISVNDFSSDGFFQMGRPPVRIDILMSIEAVNFTDAWQNRQVGDFDGVTAWFIGLSELIQNNRSAAQPQDLVDLENLENKRR